MQHKNFFMVANSIFERKLKPRDFIVYCCLLRHSSTDNSCFPSRRLLAEECNMDKKTADAALENLSTLGLVKIIHRYREDGRRTSNLYYVVNLLDAA